ncbi:hypothetical protein IU436_09150 [Nocardia farcinica]|uniref:Secreted protein n=1 Tax=Nocardia farcinica TaxID=37329 RepID=A0A449GBE0_NOCFR|nr:hypothetical protein [Nocardia farcinica]MBF6231285.1 hypothetical protein [Nocardia farcinica]MBF6278862.1 hypothetical protein [Nocardia farcinica]MBF6419042.1 hypothetical protein [Nocardia farcinica]MBF6430519.1 hypothetical protein [Nocardia farcinica]MBF6441931.1 hypothetical protein [Nocardia farcinica]
MTMSRTFATVAVAAVIASTAGFAPAVAAPPAVAVADTGSAAGSSEYARGLVELVVCLFKGELVGSRAPLC